MFKNSFGYSFKSFEVVRLLKNIFSRVWSRAIFVSNDCFVFYSVFYGRQCCVPLTTTTGTTTKSVKRYQLFLISIMILIGSTTIYYWWMPRRKGNKWAMKNLIHCNYKKRMLQVDLLVLVTTWTIKDKKPFWLDDNIVISDDEYLFFHGGHRHHL